VPEGRRVIDAAVQFAAAPTLRAPARLQHHAQDTIDAEPGVRQRRASAQFQAAIAVTANPRVMRNDRAIIHTDSSPDHASFAERRDASRAYG